ncbi:MAG: ATP-dependent DNA ligase, partial [Actinomycetota bacterium]|nr:ATP-dependent DNA ligase [Actinomycetota bacterium]
MLFAEVVAVSATVGATRSRKTKIEALAGHLRRLPPDEVEPVVAWLAGEPRQGRIGTGWRTMSNLDGAAAPVASLTVTAADEALTALATTAGTGSVRRRADTLGRLFA